MPIQITDAYKSTRFAQNQTGLLFNLPQPAAEDAQLPEGVSLCMIVKNEERFLAECLDSVKDVVDEINIVDTGSTDRTVEIARSYGAKMQFREWQNDFAWARNVSLEMATRRWIIVLDADEELRHESVELVRSLRTVPAGLCAVYTNIVNKIEDAMGTGKMSHRLIRVFPSNPKLRYEGVIHETLVRLDSPGEMQAVLSPITIFHKGYTGEILSAREKSQRNRPLVARAYEEHGDDSFSLFNFGNASIVAGDVQLGIEVLERMLNTFTGPPKVYFPLAYVMLAQTYCEQLGENERALEYATEGSERFPDDAGLVFTTGQILSRLGRYEEARERYGKALTMRERSLYTAMTDEEIFEWKIFYAMAGAYEFEENFEKAVECIDQALLNKPRSIQLAAAKAKLLERLERYYEAETVYRKMCEIDPHAGRVDLANFLLRRQRYAQAIAIVEDEIDPIANANVVAQLHVAAARAVQALGSGDPLPFLEAAIFRSPGCGSALALLDGLLTERGDITRRDRLHREELLAECVMPEDFARRSFRLLALGRAADAQLIAEEGLQVDTGYSELRFNLAMALLRQGDETRALHELGRVRPDAPAVYASAMQHSASLLLAGGHVDEAVAALDRALSVAADPNLVISGAKSLVEAGARGAGRALLERHATSDSRIALELAGMLLQDGDFAGAGRIAAGALQ